MVPKLPVLGLVIFLTASLPAQPFITLPFRVAGSLILIEGKADGKAGYFIVDTGVDHLTLNSDHFRGKTLASGFTNILGRHTERKGRQVLFELGGNINVRMYADVLSLTRVERSIGSPVLGLLGIRFLKGFVLHLDFQRQLFTLYRPEAFPRPALAQQLGEPEILPFSWSRHLLCIRATWGSHPFNLALDTGAEIGILDKRAAKRLDLSLFGSERVRMVSFGYTGDERPLYRVRHLYFGDRPGPPFLLVLAPLYTLNNNLPGPALDGIVGYKALGAMQLTIHFREKKMYLWGGFPEPEPPTLVRLAKQKLSGQ